jgi:energy-coupling factor transporter ATP-binding protein EcfA2
MKFPGTRWYKCDLHLHTTASDCFKDQKVSSKEWVDRALEQGLECVAVTDHNTAGGVDEIIAAAEGTSLKVFPGVEVTCDTSKIHLLVLFNISKRAIDVEDFLIRCGIRREDFGKKTAFTTKSVIEIIQEAENQGCLVIPAHVDQHSGLCGASHSIINEIYDFESITGVQIVHQEFLEDGIEIKGNTNLRTAISSYYPQEIDESTLVNWHRPIKLALDKQKALLTFSDNPHAAADSKHGLEGIGCKYTWIKMDAEPTLESLRQALLLPKFRVRNFFQTSTAPFNVPNLWIKSITISNASVTNGSQPLRIEFSPQLTTIIGGRGSGKSGVLRFIRGILNKTSDITNLKEILEDHSSFYKKIDPKKEGVLTDATTIEVLFERLGEHYRIRATDIKSSNNQTVRIEKYDKISSNWQLIDEEGFIEFFEYEHYSQKQIFEIAKKPSSLRERIDSEISGIDELKTERDVLEREFLEISTRIRTAKAKTVGKGKVQTEVNDFDRQIQAFDESGISSLLQTKKKFQANEEILGSVGVACEEQTVLIANLVDQIELPVLELDNFEEEHKGDLLAAYDSVVLGIQGIKEKLKALQANSEEVLKEFTKSVYDSKWHKQCTENTEKFEQKKKKLQEEGVTDIEKYEDLTAKKTKKQEELVALTKLETSLEVEENQREEIRKKFIKKLQSISSKRNEFVCNILNGQNVRIKIKSFRERDSFEQKIREILQKDTGYQVEIEQLVKTVFTGGSVETQINKFRQILNSLNAGEDVDGYSGHFRNMIKKLSDEQFDRLELLMPDDEIAVEYKPSGISGFKPLATASAGQKTTAILTFILSHGTCPLILDQPEDDLDNRLVYELVVDRLRQVKEKRQIIIVTHNANIPVNGDAEYVVSMDSNSKHFQVFTEGSVDHESIKKEICDVMEGTEYAFDMRAKRYKGLAVG